MTRHRFPKLGLLFIAVSAVILSCSKSGNSNDQGSGGTSVVGGSGGDMMGGSGSNATGSGGKTGDGGVQAEGPTPKYYPVPGFEDCVHAEVKEDCEHGWCKLPPSCFVMGSPEDEWERGLATETQAAVTLTHSIEVQQLELTRGEWTTITGLTPLGPETCTDDHCPVAMVSWWDAVIAADLLSKARGLLPCYAPLECTGRLGVDLQCTGVLDPEKSVYECEGYRLPTRAEIEYAARAGTWSTWYSGDITRYDDLECHSDAAFEKIAWYCFNSQQQVHKGGELLPNGWGLSDIFGNVEEYSGEQKTGSSPGGVNPRGSVGSGGRKLTFGGRYESWAYLARTANLLSGSPEGRGPGVGFRLYRTLFEDSVRSDAIVGK